MPERLCSCCEPYALSNLSPLWISSHANTEVQQRHSHFIGLILIGTYSWNAEFDLSRMQLLYTSSYVWLESDPASSVIFYWECAILYSWTLTTLTKKSWSNVGQNLVNRPTFDYALFGEHMTKVLVISWSQVSQKLVKWLKCWSNLSQRLVKS